MPTLPHLAMDPASTENLSAARDLLGFIQAAPTPRHAVAEVLRRLAEAGFQSFDEGDSWELAPGTRGYVRRGGSIAAFVVGGEPPHQAGFSLVGAHTDSPNLRVKPVSDGESAGYATLAVEVYGGVLLSTWLDRDLSLAGYLVLGDGTEALARLDGPVCRVPNLAIHLNRDVNKEGLVLNPQNHLSPVIALSGESVPSLLERACAALDGSFAGVRPGDVSSFELSLFDSQPGTLGGANSEFVFSARLDNLASCHAALTALLASPRETAKTRAFVLYDHEEVGSQSATGARSDFLGTLLSRLSRGGGDDALPRALSRSLLVSADMAHGVHPNYPDKHDKLHRPMLGRGPVIKVNANQSYATDAQGTAAFTRACQAEQLTPQYFVSRNDMPCGSTIGPISAARLGLTTVDVGNPMLSMHSCREMAGSADVLPMIRVLSRLFT
jgi:aspartyl aminopeptidase